MEVYFLRLKNQMAHFLENDEKIRQGIFTENLTAEIFTDVYKRQDHGKRRESDYDHYFHRNGL